MAFLWGNKHIICLDRSKMLALAEERDYIKQGLVESKRQFLGELKQWLDENGHSFKLDENPTAFPTILIKCNATTAKAIEQRFPLVAEVRADKNEKIVEKDDRAIHHLFGHIGLASLSLSMLLLLLSAFNRVMSFLKIPISIVEKQEKINELKKNIDKRYTQPFGYACHAISFLFLIAYYSSILLLLLSIIDWTTGLVEIPKNWLAITILCFVILAACLFLIVHVQLKKRFPRFWGNWTR